MEAERCRSTLTEPGRTGRPIRTSGLLRHTKKPALCQSTSLTSASMDTTPPPTTFIQHRPTEVDPFKDGLTPQQKELRVSYRKKLRELPKELGVQLLHEHCYLMIGWHNMTRDEVIGWWGMFQTNEPRSGCSTPTPLQMEEETGLAEPARATDTGKPPPPAEKA